MKRIFIFAILIFVVSMANASASNYVSHKKADGSEERYSTYEAKNMYRNAENNWMHVIYRNCTQLTAKQVITREKLQPNSNITGGFYCGLPNDSTTILIKNIRLIKNDTVVVTQ